MNSGTYRCENPVCALGGPGEPGYFGGNPSNGGYCPNCRQAGVLVEQEEIDAQQAGLDTAAQARQDYVDDRIGLEELERRLEACLTTQEGGVSHG